MNYFKSRSIEIFPLLIIAALVFTTFNAANVFAAVNVESANQVKMNLQRKGFRKRVKNLRIATSNLPENDSSSNRNNAPLEAAAAGDLDTTFGTNGKVTTIINNSKGEALAAAVQSDGKFVASGYVFNGSNTDFALVRYNVDGSVDTAFGNNGKVTTDIGNADNESFALAIQSDGKIIAAGSSYNGSNEDFALVRYNSNGTLDTTFGTNGIVTTDFGNTPEVVNGLAVQSDGRIVVAGYRLLNQYFDFALARYNSDGTLDGSFGSGGKVTTDLSGVDDLGRAVVINSDGKIIVVGESNTDFAAARYNSDGSLDSTFNGTGKVITSINLFDSAYSVALQSDGKFVAAGETGDGSNADFALIRYNTDGSLDSTFGAKGIVTTPIGGRDGFATSVVVQNGKVIAGGFSFNGNNDDFAVVRYNSDGSPDTTFGAGGKVITDFGGSSNDYISALAIASGGRLIAVGSANLNFAAAAYKLGSSSCIYTLSPTTAEISGNGGSSSFSVTTQSGCSFTAETNASWIILTGNTTGTGNAVISFLVGSNGTTPRTGTITVGGEVFTLNQAAGAGKTRKRARFF